MEESKQTDLSEDEKQLFSTLMPEDLQEIMDTGLHRRHFLKLLALTGGGALAAQLMGLEEVAARPYADLVTEASPSSMENAVRVNFRVNGKPVTVNVDSRMTLLDTLRERLNLTGSKKGCDHGQCGACTVLMEGKRVLSCLTLAASCEATQVKTIEGMAKGNNLHPMQAAFLKHDGFQCGFCTPGQICSAVALLDEAKNGEASYVTTVIRKKSANLQLSDDEIRERMSGNICRCGAYPNIVAAVREVHSGKRDDKENWQFAD
jgi:xanthine dehydrogenase YagT iron-sulfur-binding subunit